MTATYRRDTLHLISMTRCDFKVKLFSRTQTIELQVHDEINERH